MKRQKGQSIIEALVALMTILLIMTAIAIVIVNGLYNSQFVKNQNEANKYAQQGMEFVRNIQRNDLQTFANYYGGTSDDPTDPDDTNIPDGPLPLLCIVPTGTTLVADTNPETCSETGVNLAGVYNRTVSFSLPGEDCQVNEIKVTVTVKWSSSKCGQNTFCHQSQLQSCMRTSLPASKP